MIHSSISEVLSLEFDVCVVGSGPAGICLALELSKLGRKVLILESGQLDSNELHQELSTAELLDPDVHDDMRIATSRQLGGTSNLWGARCQPMDEVDFLAGRSFANTVWPIALSELLPHYDAACSYLDAGPAVFRVPFEGIDAEEEQFEFTRIERFSNTPAVQILHRKELSTSERIHICLDSTVIGADFDGTEIKALIVSSLNGSKVRLPVETVVLACGGLETTRLLLSFQQDHKRLFGGEKGALGRYYMGHIIGEVADIFIQNPALDSGMDFIKIENESYIRRRFTPSKLTQLSNGLPNVSFWPVVPPVADARHKSGLLSIVFLVFSFGPFGRMLVAEAIRIRHVPKGFKRWPHFLNILKDLPQTVGYIPSFFWNRYFEKLKLPGFFVRNSAQIYGLSYHAEQSPHADSCVWLSEKKDVLGLRQLCVDLKFRRSDAEAVFRAHQLLDEWLRENKLGYVKYRQDEDETVDAIMNLFSHGTHQLGTARMSSGESGGVVDANLLCFGTTNLYVSSSAVFPSSGQCNPTLTVAALSIRLAHHLAYTR